MFLKSFVQRDVVVVVVVIVAVVVTVVYKLSEFKAHCFSQIIIIASQHQKSSQPFSDNHSMIGSIKAEAVLLKGSRIIIFYIIAEGVIFIY